MFSAIQMHITLLRNLFLALLSGLVEELCSSQRYTPLILFTIKHGDLLGLGCEDRHLGRRTTL